MLLIIGLGAGFFGGMQYQKSQAPAGRASRAGQFASRFGAKGQNGAVANGQILSIDANSMTVKLRDGSSKIVLLPDSATISKSTTGAKSDLTVGANVAAFGTTNSDGSITATNVSLNPAMGLGGARGSASPSSSGANGGQAY